MATNPTGATARPRRARPVTDREVRFGMVRHRRHGMGQQGEVMSMHGKADSGKARQAKLGLLGLVVDRSVRLVLLGQVSQRWGRGASHRQVWQAQQGYDGIGTAWPGAAGMVRLVLAGHGFVWAAGQVWVGQRAAGPGVAGKASSGWVRPGFARRGRRGVAARGSAGVVGHGRIGAAALGAARQAWQGRVGRGGAWRGRARRDSARSSNAQQSSARQARQWLG